MTIIDRDYKFYGLDKIKKLLEQNYFKMLLTKLRIWSYDGLEMMERAVKSLVIFSSIFPFK